MSAEVSTPESNDARFRRASLFKCGFSWMSTSAQADDSIQTGIFSRPPLESMTVTAPSPVLGQQMTRSVLPRSGWKG